MSEGWNIHDEFRRQVHLCQGIGKHAMMDIVYQQFPAEREAASKKEADHADLYERHTALLEKLKALPQKWRDISYKTTDAYTNLHGCADELEAIIEQEKQDG